MTVEGSEQRRLSQIPSVADCAVIVIDMHKGHLGPDATIPVAFADMIRPALTDLLEQVRAMGIPVIHVRHENIDGIHNQQPVWVLKDWPRDHCVPGSPTTEFVVVPEPGDFVIDYKRTFNAFAHTDLDLYLRRLHRSTVVVTGVTSDCCCLATAFGGVDLHYRVIALSDCQASMDLESHQNALKIVDSVLGQVMTSQQFVAGCIEREGSLA